MTLREVIEALPIGSTLTRTEHGWEVRKAMPAGPRVFGSGKTIQEAFEAIGQRARWDYSDTEIAAMTPAQRAKLGVL